MDNEQFEREALFSMLKDSANALVRTHLRPQQFLLVETQRGGWSEQLVLAYVPLLAREVPLDAATVVAGSDDDEVAFWLVLPRELLLGAVESFLVWFLKSSVERGAVRADAINAATNEALMQIADQVATSWERTGF